MLSEERIIGPIRAVGRPARWLLGSSRKESGGLEEGHWRRWKVTAKPKERVCKTHWIFQMAELLRVEWGWGKIEDSRHLWWKLLTWDSWRMGWAPRSPLQVTSIFFSSSWGSSRARMWWRDSRSKGRGQKGTRLWSSPPFGAALLPLGLPVSICALFLQGQPLLCLASSGYSSHPLATALLVEIKLPCLQGLINGIAHHPKNWWSF